MKVTVTQLKAPWPAGAKLDDVVEVGESLPGCFAGKCLLASEDAEATHTYVPTSAGQPSLRAQLDAVLAENAALKALLEAGGPIKPQASRGR